MRLLGSDLKAAMRERQMIHTVGFQCPPSFFFHWLASGTCMPTWWARTLRTAFPSSSLQCQAIIGARNFSSSRWLRMEPIITSFVSDALKKPVTTLGSLEKSVFPVWLQMQQKPSKRVTSLQFDVEFATDILHGSKRMQDFHTSKTKSSKPRSWQTLTDFRLHKERKFSVGVFSSSIMHSVVGKTQICFAYTSLGAEELILSAFITFNCNS